MGERAAPIFNDFAASRRLLRLSRNMLAVLAVAIAAIWIRCYLRADSVSYTSAPVARDGRQSQWSVRLSASAGGFESRIVLITRSSIDFRTWANAHNYGHVPARAVAIGVSGVHVESRASPKYPREVHAPWGSVETNIWELLGIDAYSDRWQAVPGDVRRTYCLVLPIWLLFVSVGCPLMIRLWVRRRARRRVRSGLCERCGYDLRCSTGCCPECGPASGVRGDSSRRPRPQD